MKASEFKLKMHDGVEIQVYEWIPDKENTIKGIVQIVHGLAEHAKRYSDFARFLTENGYAVFANDHRGHGKTAGDLKNIGYFGPKNGWTNLVSDIKVLSVHARGKYPNKGFFIMGHSFGSFLSRNVVLDPAYRISGAIFSGTAGHPGILGYVGIMLTKLLMYIYPKNSPSVLLNTLSFGAYNKPFKPNRTSYDWLSRDSEEVDKYVQDQYCGNIFSISAFNEIAKGLLFINQQTNINKTPEELSVLFLSGAKDPVGNFGKGVNEVYEKFIKAGIKNISLKIFPDGRHEMLNEINKSEVYQFILNWLNKNS